MADRTRVDSVLDDTDAVDFQPPGVSHRPGEIDPGGRDAVKTRERNRR